MSLSLCDNGFHCAFLDRMLDTKKNRKKTKLDVISEKLCASKDTFEKRKRQRTKQEKILMSHTSSM